MNIKERIILLFKSLKEEDVILGAKLLSTVETLKEQIEIFTEASKAGIGEGNAFQRCVLVNRMIYPEPKNAIDREWVAIIGAKWMLMLAKSSRMYMMDMKKVDMEYLKEIVSPTRMKTVEL